MAKEYIEREAACALMPDDYYGWRDKQILNFIPAADVVPVVRCGECKHRHDDNFCGGRGWPEQLVPDDGYCDCGARREGDGNE